MSNDKQLESVDLYDDSVYEDVNDDNDDDFGGLDELMEQSFDNDSKESERDSLPLSISKAESSKEEKQKHDEVSKNEENKDEKHEVRKSFVHDESQSRLIVNDIFISTGIKITEDDPLILMMLHNSSLLNLAKKDLVASLKKNNAELLQAIQDKHEDGLDAFNGRIVYLEKLLARLEEQKEAIIQDVWSKSQNIMYDRTKTTMQKAINEMIKDGQGAINSQRNILIGAVTGMILGMILTAIIIAFT